MRTRNVVAVLFVLIAALGASGAARAFDPLPGETPAQVFLRGYQAYQAGDLETAAAAIEYAAAQGYTRARWMLGQMYAQGVGFPRNDERAFEIFASIANDHSGDNPVGEDAPFIANALVALGDYFRSGLLGESEADGSGVERARQLYWHAATYFADPDAQYNLAQMFEGGELGPPDPLQAVRWARMSAETGNPSAQALLGYLLFEGDGVEREPVVGLAYLQIARVRTNGQDSDIRRMHEEAFALATETERRTAVALAEQWLSANETGAP
ncbi:MAG: sel1 repeat family protein [Bauldia sp.]|nr:sel1 repeat family protein [Bauldia sp.]